MRVAVITPFHSESTEWLEQCHASVMGQSVACTHIMIGDASNVRPPSTALHIPLPKNVGDYGDTPRCIGSFYAAGLGYDVVMYLDGDNWFHPSHVETILSARDKTSASIVTSRRILVRLDGSPMAECLGSDGQQFCDTNCLAVFRPAFSVFAVWSLMHPSLHPIDDRVIWKFILDSKFDRADTGVPTVYYRATHASFYRDLKEEAPHGAKKSTSIAMAVAQWRSMGHELPITWAYRRLSAGL